ncbi:beta-agarase [Rubellicoccus peritrichatus]|uniref:Beta-agarase n=1 Tax=Rubellicoccus peritrichatus TaxID=3080537 RepID=A0AAQ3L5L0_9BACT|nr:beta-agarase [Puniceicoccus sp. CR14]WOO39306.1 beta-agarase [Puniceicoccus sp. CR14]
MKRIKKSPLGVITTGLTLFVIGFGPAGCTSLTESKTDTVSITVDPHITREIQGISDLERKRYFAISDSGTNFDNKVKDPELYDYLVNELNISFGRSLGPVQSVTHWNKLVEEDPNRPGYANIEKLKADLAKRSTQPSERMRRDFGDNLNVATHGHQQAYPKFMGEHMSEEAKKAHHAHHLPENIDAAVELAVAVFQNNYNDFSRPAYYEPVNEPHWSYAGDQQLADWHMQLNEAFDEQVPDVEVGGLCMSVSYMYDHNYRAWNGLKKFIDNTDASLDFYSFHVYDYLNFEDGEFNGRIQTGLPMEGVLDLVQNYTVIEHGKEVPIVISEHGGYVTGNHGKSGDEIAEEIAQQYFPGEGFDWEVKKRSIMNFNGVSSMLASTMNFMDHPHTVQKAVPFMLLESFSWDPKYYASLYTPYNFEDKSQWVPSRNLDFYEFFRDLNGRRVLVESGSPDIQTQAFVEGNKLHVLLNNLWTEPEALSFDLPLAQHYSVRRLGRNADFTPYVLDEEVKSLKDLTIQGREALIITAEYKKPISQDEVVNEIPYYGNKVIFPVEANGQNEAMITVPDPSEIEYATLRIGFRRPVGTNYSLSVKFNGHPVDMPVEKSASRLEGNSDFATTRIASIDPSWIQNENTVTTSFPDGKEGTIGSVVLRAATVVQ